MESKNYEKSLIKDIEKMNLEELRSEGVLIYNLYPTERIKKAIQEHYKLLKIK